MNTATPSVETILAQAVEIATPTQRQAFVEQACGGDAALQCRVEQLIANHFQAGSFLERPAVALDPDGTAGWETATSAEGPGTVIGPYKLLEQLGEGGMGLVYVAEQQQPIKRRVALKIIKPGMDSREMIARFEAERQALALMDHPNIAKVHDGGTTPEGRPYFVMELVMGTPITAYCDRYRLSMRQRLQLFLDVCYAVQHAHQKGIIHRDLKPSNVLVEVHDVHAVVKIIDFGIAKATGQQLTEKTVHTALTQLVGTPLYMSPEQAGLSSLDVDTRSDVYSLGVLLYELLTGTTPFDSETLKKASYDEMRRIIREEEPARPSTRLSTTQQATLSTIAERRGLAPHRLSQQLRGELDWIVMKALEKDRNRRYETASAFAADVQRYLDDEPVQACQPSQLYRLRKFVRRHKAGLGVAAGVLVLLVFGFSFAFWWVQKRTGVATEARAALQEAERWQQEEKWSEALSAVRRAKGVLGGFGADAALQHQIEQRGKDVEMAQRLEEARLQETAVKDGHFDTEACAAAYAAAFQWYGLDVEHLDPAEAGERIRAQSIQRQLVTALDHWAFLHRKQKDRVKQLLTVARAADLDPWRNRLRGFLEGKDPKALSELAASVQPDELPPATAVVLARLTMETPEAERVAIFLRQLQQRHPNDFWVNHELAFCLQFLRPPRLEEAIRFYTAAIALRPQSPGAHLNLGAALREKGRLDEAIAEYREALQLKIDYAEAHCSLGSVLMDKGRLDEAIVECREALRLKKDFAQAHCNLGNALHQKGQLDEAIDEFHEAIRIKKDYANAHSGLGNALRDKGLLDEAIVECREAIRIEKDYAEAHNSLGGVLFNKGQLDEAIAEWREALRLKKDDAQAHNNLGGALCKKGRLDEAIIECREAIRLKKDYAGAHLNLGIVLDCKGQLDEAIAEYREAIRLKQDDADAHCVLGDCLLKKGQLDEAIDEYHEAIRIKKDYANAHFGLGNALREKGRLDEAIAEFLEALRIKKNYVEAHNNLGNVLHAKGQVDEAITEYREAIRLNKDYALAHYSLGNTLRQKGQLDEAIAELKDVIRLKKDYYAEAHCNLGATLEQKGQFREALVYRRRGHELGSKNPRWPYPSAQWVRRSERLVELDDKLAAILNGQKQPADTAEGLALAQLCWMPCKKCYAAAARFSSEAFAEEPKLADDLNTQHRYNAACAAALAGCGQGQNAAALDDKERARLRQQALDWLRTDLKAYRQVIEKSAGKAGPAIEQRMQHWLKDDGFASVRGAESLAKLPETERKEWEKLWQEVEALRQVAAERPAAASSARP